LATGLDLRAKIQLMANDDTLDYGADNYLDALNWAINVVSKARIKALDPEFIFDLSITNGGSVPDNFQGFVGNYNITIKDTGNGRQFFHNLSPNPTARFYVNRPNLATINDTVPFKTTLLEAIKLAALIYLKEQRAYKMDAEKERLTAMIS